MVVQLRRMAFLNKIYSPREVDLCPLSLKAVWGPPLFSFHFLGLHILNYKCTNFYQNLSAGSIWVELFSLKKIKVIAYRQEPSDKMLTHSNSQDSVLMGSLLRYTFTKECFEERT